MNRNRRHPFTDLLDKSRDDPDDLYKLPYQIALLGY